MQVGFSFRGFCWSSFQLLSAPACAWPFQYNGMNTVHCKTQPATWSSAEGGRTCNLLRETLRQAGMQRLKSSIPTPSTGSYYYVQSPEELRSGLPDAGGLQYHACPPQRHPEEGCRLDFVPEEFCWSSFQLSRPLLHARGHFNTTG